LPGEGNKTTKVIRLEDVIELVMVLPGKRSKRVRKQFADIVTRYLDGDLKLCEEVKENRILGKAKSYAKFARTTFDKVTEEEETINATAMLITFFIYATKSPAFPGLIKIGKTENIRTRLSGMNTSCAPLPHVVLCMAPTLDKNLDERLAHEFFADARREGEFFAISEEQVIDYFQNVITAQYHRQIAQRTASCRGLLLTDE